MKGIFLILHFLDIFCICYVFMNVKQYSSSTFLWIYGDMWDCKNQRWNVIGYCNII